MRRVEIPPPRIASEYPPAGVYGRCVCGITYETGEKEINGVTAVHVERKDYMGKRTGIYWLIGWLIACQDCGKSVFFPHPRLDNLLSI